MTSQIFKNHIPNELVFELFDANFIKMSNYYIINNNDYKKGIYNNTIPEFINKCAPYYYMSKRKYLEKPLTYKSFITIIRQICNFNNIKYTSQIKYDKSNYEMVYYIYV